MKRRVNDNPFINSGGVKGTKSTGIANGTKKTKNIQDNLRKSQPVFKSITARRR